MRSLDEVIKAFEICHETLNDCTGCPYDNGTMSCRNSDCYCRDANTYLKMYCSDKAQWEADRKAYEEDRKQKLAECEAVRDKYINRLKELKIGTLNKPMTWEELQKMERKPVWVEMDDQKGWYLVCGIDDLFVWVADAHGDQHNFPRCCLGKIFQVYREERG